MSGTQKEIAPLAGAKNKIRAYYVLTKPGIIYGNALTLIGGFLLAAQGRVDLQLLLATLAGVSLIIGAACVINNYLDRKLDIKMARTKARPSVQGTISPRAGLIYATILGTLGFALLGLYVSALVVAIGIVGVVDYIVFYSLAKRRTPHGTLVGTICGATPILAGYCAVTGWLDLGAWLLFAVMVCWQMAHFFAIATYRLQDYQAASLPVWPAVHGLASTRRAIIGYIIAFMLAIASLTIFHYTGFVFLLVVIAISTRWLYLALQKFADPTTQAKKIFLFSLTVILAFSLMLSIDTFLP